MSTTEIQAIDVHGHYGEYRRDDSPPGVNDFMSADAMTVVARAKQVNIETTIVSPLAGLMPRGRANAEQANKEAAQAVAQTGGLLQWVIVHPLQPQTFQQAAEMLARPQCVGIKLHPEEHVYPIRDHGDALFEFAAQHDAVVLVHSGDANSLPIDFIPFADRHPNITLILAHLGNGGGAGGDPSLQVRAIQASRQGNVLVDTSSARSLMPGLIEWAVQEIGVERILFGTDTPLYSVAMQRARIDQADLSDEDKRLILRKNAQWLFSAALLQVENQSC